MSHPIPLFYSLGWGIGGCECLSLVFIEEFTAYYLAGTSSVFIIIPVKDPPLPYLLAPYLTFRQKRKGQVKISGRYKKKTH